MDTLLTRKAIILLGLYITITSTRIYNTCILCIIQILPKHFLSLKIMRWDILMGHIAFGLCVRPSVRSSHFLAHLSRTSSTFSNIFSSEATGAIEAKFHMDPSWVCVCGGGRGGERESLLKQSWSHDKMAIMPIYGKNLKQSFPEPKDR